MTGDVRRAGAFLGVGALSLLAPALVGRTDPIVAAAGTVGPFGIVAGAALATTNGPGFELFARDGDREEGRLYGLAGFALAAAALGLFVVAAEMPAETFVAAIFVLTTGNFGGALAATRWTDAAKVTATFVGFGTIGGLLGLVAAGSIAGSEPEPVIGLFVAATGALAAALLRTALFRRDDALVVVTIALIAWLLSTLVDAPAADRVVVGLSLAVVLGVVAYGIGSASITGALTGVPLALLTVVLGGYGWFALLVTFFGLGSLASKFRYDEKLERGIAQADEGARGSANVLANSLVAVAAVVGFANGGVGGIDPELFRIAFAGAVAAALADTFSSEFGGLYDDPRLITTLERVDPGTDGAVTWQGAVAGIVGAGVVAGVAAISFEYAPVTTAIVVAAGAVGMTADSLFGATLEGELLDNQTVNLLATLVAALFAIIAATAL